MSIEHTISVRCPRCQTEDTVQVWESINASLDLDQKKALLQGDLNTFVCRSCGTKVLIPVAFMYHDMERQICVQYYPFEALRKPDFFDHFALNGDISKKVSKDLQLPDYMRKRQIVFDMAELVRYIVFRERLYEFWDGLDEGR